MYPGGIGEHRYPHLKKKSQEFALSGKVAFNILAMRKEPGFLHKRVQYEFSFRTENVLRMKMGNLKKSCLKTCYKILKFAKFEMGYRYSAGHHAYYVKTLANFFTAAGQ